MARAAGLLHLGTYCSPFDPEKGPGYIRATIANMEEIGLSDVEKEKIYANNAARLLGVKVS